MQHSWATDMSSTLRKFGVCRNESEARIVAALIASAERVGVAKAADEALACAHKCGEQTQRLRTTIRVLADLISHGWQFKVTGLDIVATAEQGCESEPRRDYVRRVQLGQREQQLLKPSVREFVRQMERRRLGPNGWVSIFSLMRDGRELASALKSTFPPKSIVPDVINPYIQVINGPDQRCEFTGLRLMDVWRYFRYTWAMPYNSVPGRSMLILIRDAGAANHPVSGIAALGSAIVQMSQRDSWIGWTGPDFLRRVQDQPTKTISSWVSRQLDELVDAIYRKDLVSEGVISSQEVRRPTRDTSAKLRTAADRAWTVHRKFPSRKDHKEREYTNRHWRRQTLLPLFRAKRCETLAQLLQARKALNDCRFDGTVAGLQRVLSQPSGRRAVEIIIRAVKARHIGIDMLDITICGAVPPYNPLLGGKLVAMLLCSPEVSRAYWNRYRRMPSVIASSMAGRTVCRVPKLVLLGTTSLYGERLNQYHRIQIPPGVARNVTPVRFTYLGESIGFGSSHLSRDTVTELELLLAQSSQGRRVNSIFGEGVSPRLRKIRDGLALIGFDPEFVLKHGNKRLVYGVPLASNFREVLVGLNRVAKYILPQLRCKQATQSIASYWASRWLDRRLANHPEVIEDIAHNDLRLSYAHAARVKLPELPAETLPLFA